MLADFARGLSVEQLNAAGADILFILPVPATALQRFVKESAAPPFVAARLFADPTAAIAKAAACSLKFDSRATFTSPHAQTTVLQATLRGFAMGLRTGMQGDPRQQGGAWVLLEQASDGGAAAAVDGGWRTTWGKRDRHNADQTPLALLVHHAGAPAAAYVHPRAAAVVAAAGTTE